MTEDNYDHTLPPMETNVKVKKVCDGCNEEFDSDDLIRLNKKCLCVECWDKEVNP